MRASAHGARVRERPRRMASHSLGWVSGWARTARVGRIQLPAHACACERSTARASLERPARVEGRPRAHPRATEAWRTGCGVAKGWAQKRAHRGGRARAEEVCTRVTWPFCQGLPQRGRPPALWGNAKACVETSGKVLCFDSIFVQIQMHAGRARGSFVAEERFVEGPSWFLM